LVPDDRGEEAHPAEWFLTTEEKKRILLNNVYGVDIDPQAVEVTKLSLLLKVLEAEYSDSLGQQLELIRERALPDLASNIKCGNSLIGPDFYDGEQLSLLDAEEMYRINPFDWEAQYPDMMKEGGFHAVIGNPPYVRQEMLGQLKQYLKGRFQTYHGVADLYVYFIERAVGLLREGGIFSFIVANKWMRANYGRPLREWLKKQRIEEIIDFGDLPVFEQATTYPCILRLKKGEPSATFQATQVKTLDFGGLTDYVREHCYGVRQAALDSGGWSLVDERTQALLDKLRRSGVPLGDYVNGRIYRGVLSGLNKAFVIDGETQQRLISEDPASAELIKPFLAGRDVKRYQPPQSQRYLIFTRRGVKIEDYPAIERHLAAFKEQLKPKPKGWRGATWKGRKPGSYKWYEIQDTVGYYAEFEKPKMILPDISLRGNFMLDDKGKYYSVNTTYIIPIDDRYVLGLLNSWLITYFYQSISSTYRGGYLRFIYQYLVRVPIRAIDFSDPADVERHDRMVALVERMLALHKQLADAKTPMAKELLQRQIDATDRQIDRLVYELYGLTEEEIKIVEDAGS